MILVKNSRAEFAYSWMVAHQFNPYSAAIDFKRQNLTSVDVIFWSLKSIPALEEKKYRTGGENKYLGWP